ncbi:MAG: 50S ribosomal protein L15 [Deltaproteobacteria bacterium]|nr:50S ribosomal protein L15 [Deltaproteobacteria bacterium]
MILHQLENPPGARKTKKRKGRGNGSGMGKTATRGSKGQYARNTVARGFEGGQTPLRRRLPRRGFNNLFRVSYWVVNLSDLEQKTALSAKNTITVEDLVAARSIRNRNKPVKVLGVGELKRAVKIHAHAFSASAMEKIKAAGGEAVVIEG